MHVAKVARLRNGRVYNAGGVWVFGSHALGWWRQPDPLFTFIMLMTNATPSGNQIQVRAL